MKESWIESAVKTFIYTRGGWGQKVHSGSLMIAGQGKMRHKQYKINLADKWTPDTLFCIPMEVTQEMVWSTIGVFVAVEMKRSAVEVKKWKNLEARALGGEKLPFSYDREEQQIVQARRIRKAGGLHYVAHSLVDFIEQIILKFPNLK